MKKPRQLWTVTVSNLGLVYSGFSEKRARAEFEAYKNIVSAPRGRLSGETAYLYCNDDAHGFGAGEIVAEYTNEFQSFRHGTREDNPMKKQFRPPYHVDLHAERGEVTIYVTDANDNEVWYADTETVQDLADSGYLDTRGLVMGRNIRPEYLERSVISYLREMGIIPRDEERMNWRAGASDVYADAADLYDEPKSRFDADSGVDLSKPRREQNPRRRNDNYSLFIESVSGKRKLFNTYSDLDIAMEDAAHLKRNYGETVTLEDRNGTVVETGSRRRNPNDDYRHSLRVKRMIDDNVRRGYENIEKTREKFWVIEWFNEDHPVTPSWVQYAAFQDSPEGARDTLAAIQHKHPDKEYRLAEDRLRARAEARYDNPTTADLDQWAGKYRKALEPLNDGKPAHPKYVIKVTKKDGAVGYFKGRLKFDTEMSSAKIYRNSERANEAATKVKNLLQKDRPFEAKAIKRIEVVPLDAGK